MFNRRNVLKGSVFSSIAAWFTTPSKGAVFPAKKPYATVYGVGHDLQPIQHEIWHPMSVAEFGGSPEIEQFLEVTSWEWGFEMPPIRYWPETHINWNQRKLDRFSGPAKVQEGGFTNIVSLQALEDFRKASEPPKG